MQKEIFEQPESIVNTMRGRVKGYDGKCSVKHYAFSGCVNKSGQYPQVE